MSPPARVWLAAQHHKAFQNGGWAYVLATGSEVSGYAGGARRTTRARMALTGLTAALGRVAGEVMIFVDPADVGLLAPPRDPAEDADLRTALAPQLARLKLVRAEGGPGTPLAFAQAWADTAGDQARAKGAFAAAIPRPNLAKVQGL